MNNKTILVTAATGDTGRHTVRLLLERGYKVRAIAHRPDRRSEALAEAGAEVIFGDLLDMDFVTQATKDIDTAYFCYPIKPGILQATAYFAQAATENNLRAIVNMSQISSRRDSQSHAAQDHWISEQVFNSFGLNVTHLRPTYFAEWLLYLAPMIAQGMMNVPFKDNRHAPIAAADQARVIAAILADPVPHAGKVYPLYGPVELTQEQIASEAGKALGIDVKYSYVDFDTFFEVLKAARKALNKDNSAAAQHKTADEGKEGEEAESFLGQHLREVAIDYANGLFAGTNDIVKTVGGVPGTTVKQFVKDHADAFKSKGGCKIGKNRRSGAEQCPKSFT